MMCWESLEDSEHEIKKREVIRQDKERNDDKEKQDDEEHIQSTLYTGNRLNIPVEELKLGVHDDASTLATQETLVKNLVYIMNIQDRKLGTMKNTQDNSKTPSEQDDKKPTAKTSPLEKSVSVNSNDTY